MDVEIVRMSSKGQFVLPLSMRKRLKVVKGGKLMLIENKGTVVARPISQMGDDIEDEIYMMERAAKGWEEIEKGRSKTMTEAEFIKELSTW